MGFWSRLFGSGFNDQKLMSLVELTIREDPLVKDHSLLSTTSENGVITLRGHVAKALEKDHIAAAVEKAIKNSGLKFERIVNEIQIK